MVVALVGIYGHRFVKVPVSNRLISELLEMKKENLNDFLRSKIYRLEMKQRLELALLKNQLHITFEKLKPVNLLKDTITEVSKSPELKNHLLTNGIGLLTGFISKKLMVGNTTSPFKNILGTVIEFVVANVVAKNSERILEKSEKFLQLFFGKLKEEKDSQVTNQ